jgi:hypothetical protein
VRSALNGKKKRVRLRLIRERKIGVACHVRWDAYAQTTVRIPSPKSHNRREREGEGESLDGAYTQDSILQDRNRRHGYAQIGLRTTHVRRNEMRV